MSNGKVEYNAVTTDFTRFQLEQDLIAEREKNKDTDLRNTALHLAMANSHGETDAATITRAKAFYSFLKGE